jgi:long-chain acyl-CoA synthetase
VGAGRAKLDRIYLDIDAPGLAASPPSARGRGGRFLVGPPGAREFPLTDVSQKFQEHEILLTGANGFLGKVVLGLLLDRYPEFKHLHILLRPSSDLSAAERFEAQTLRSPALAALRERVGERKGNDFGKITVWSGDVGRPDGGLDAAALESLQDRVGLILNCAGLVDFFPRVDESFRSNVDGVEHVVALARRLGARLLHISTCYVCGDVQGLVEESEEILGFYPHRKGSEDTRFRLDEELRLCRARIRQIYDSANSDAEHRPAGAPSRELIERLIALGRERARNWGWVNTYTYAKSLGEQIIASAPQLDYSIVRPAIVESALRFPFPGWIEGGRTAAPLVLMALGGLKDWPVRKDNPLEVVPVDLVASAVLVAGALLLDGRAARIYQLGTADVNPIEMGPLVRLLGAEARRVRKQRANGWPRFALVDPSRKVRVVTAEQAHARRERLRRRIERMQDFLGGVRRALEAARLPGRSKVSGWSTALRSLSLQTAFREQVLEQYLPFILHNRYIFESENIRVACSLISERDRQLLPWDPERIRWRDYWIHQQVAGIQKWIQPEAVREWAFKI